MHYIYCPLLCTSPKVGAYSILVLQETGLSIHLQAICTIMLAHDGEAEI